MTSTLPKRQAQDFKQRVVAEVACNVMLGAYASADALRYLFLREGSGPYALTCDHRRDEVASAISSDCPAFAWDEREMADERGVRFGDLPDPRPLRVQDGVMPHAVLAQGSGLMHFVVGPVHAGVIEPGRFTFSSGGETVVYLDAQLGYSHRGIEHAVEALDAIEAAPKVARICGGCSASRSYAYALALEALSGEKAGAENDLARLVLAELERIYNHLADLAASASGAGWGVGFTRGMGLKEETMRICQVAGGHRLLFDAIVPGGVAPGALSERGVIREALARLEQRVHRYLGALFGNASLVSRWHGAGLLSHEAVRALGGVGPAHRASHGTIDVRTFAPYGAYARIAVRSAWASAGDAFARCRVKRDELIESFRLIREALSQLGEEALPPVLRLDLGAGRTIATVEGPRGAETIAVHITPQRRIERLHVISASYRNWPLVAHAMEGNIVPDFPLVNKSFNLCYACADR